jgi:hypothetical protein
MVQVAKCLSNKRINTDKNSISVVESNYVYTTWNVGQKSKKKFVFVVFVCKMTATWESGHYIMERYITE